MKKSTILKGVGLYGMLAGVAAYKFFSYTVKRREDDGKLNPSNPYIKLIKEKSEWLDQQKTEKVSILSFDGLKLKGIFLPAEQKTDKIILAVHGFRVNAMKDFAGLVYFYHQQGYHVLLVDDRAHGASEGKYIGFGCLDREDCYRWIHYLDQRFQGKCSIFLHGISMGAATVLMTSSMNLPRSVKGIIADCPYTSIWEEFCYLTDSIFLHGISMGAATVLMTSSMNLPRSVKGIIADCPYTSIWEEFCYLTEREKKSWLIMYPIMKLAGKICKVVAGYEYDEISSAEEVKDTKIPILLIHGKEDRFVPPSMSEKIYNNCVSEKKLLIVPNAKHAESYYVAKEKYEESVLNFIK